VGRSGNDRIWPGLGVDDVNGNADIDFVDYRHPTAVGGVTVDLKNKTATDQGGSVDVIAGIENVYGTDYADMIQGDFAANILIGHAGDDQLYGMSGNDTLYGGTGADMLDGGVGDDKLYGNDNGCVDDGAVDTLVGNQGIDTGYGNALDIFDHTIENIVPC